MTNHFRHLVLIDYLSDMDLESAEDKKRKKIENPRHMLPFQGAALLSVS